MMFCTNDTTRTVDELFQTIGIETKRCKSARKETKNACKTLKDVTKNLEKMHTICVKT